MVASLRDYPTGRIIMHWGEQGATMQVNRISTCKLLLVASLLVLVSAHPTYGKANDPELKIIKDALLENGNFYFVKGTIYNPNSKAVKNVVIKYYIWKKWMGQDGHGTMIRDTGGLVSANIKYIPPKQSVDFTAVGDSHAPVMTLESGLLPDPLDAEVTAEWDR
jgi:hypothetical protein